MTTEQQNKTVVIQPQIKTTNSPGGQQVLSASIPTNSINNPAGTVTPQLVVASVQPTLPGSSKLIFTSTVSANSTNSLQGLLSASSASNVQKTNGGTLQQPGGTTHLKIASGTSPTKTSGSVISN